MKRAFLIFRAVVLVVFCSFVQWGEAGAADSRVFVLCYHSFHGNNRFDYDISLEELASQMDFSAQRDSIRFLCRLVEGAVTGKKNVLVVIDDGNQSVYQAFHEVLKPRGIWPVLASIRTSSERNRMRSPGTSSGALPGRLRYCRARVLSSHPERSSTTATAGPLSRKLRFRKRSSRKSWA